MPSACESEPTAEHAREEDVVVNNESSSSEESPQSSGAEAAHSSAAQRRKPRYRPHWVTWRERIAVTLHDAVCLAHDISPRRFDSIDESDPRRSFFQNHLTTLNQWVLYRKKIRLAPAEFFDDPLDSRTLIVLRDFVDCIREQGLFKDFPVPEKLLELQPPLPDEMENAAEEHEPEIGSTTIPPFPPNGANQERPNKAWARLVVLMAMKHYKFVPVWPPEDLRKPKKVQGLYLPLCRESKEWGIRLLSDRETVRNAVIEAVRTIGEKEVRGILEVIDGKKSSQGASEG